MSKKERAKMQDSIEFRIPTSSFLDVDKENYKLHLGRLQNYQRVLTEQKRRLKLSNDTNFQQYIENELDTTNILISIISRVTCQSEIQVPISSILKMIGVSSRKFTRALFNDEHFSPQEIVELNSKLT